MGKKDKKKKYIERLAYETDNNFIPDNKNELEEKYKKKFKKLKKLEENMNKAIEELTESKNKYDELIVELAKKREELNRMLELTNTVHKKSKEFLDMQTQIVGTTTLLSNDE